MAWYCVGKYQIYQVHRLLGDDVDGTHWCWSSWFISGGAKIEQGYRYGRVAMQMYEQVKVEAWFCRVSAIYHGCVRPWREPLGPSLTPLKHAYRSGMISGDVEYGESSWSMLEMLVFSDSPVLTLMWYTCPRLRFVPQSYGK